MIKPMSRRLLERCSRDATLLGAASVPASIFVFLLIGFAAGAACAAGLLTWLVYGRRRHADSLGNMQRFIDSPQRQGTVLETPVPASRRARTAKQLSEDDVVRRSGVTGPLGVGIVMQSMDLESFKGHGQHRGPGPEDSEQWTTVHLESPGNLPTKPGSTMAQEAQHSRDLSQDQGGIKAAWGARSTSDGLSSYAPTSVHGSPAPARRPAPLAVVPPLDLKLAMGAAPAPPPRPPPADEAGGTHRSQLDGRPVAVSTGPGSEAPDIAATRRAAEAKKARDAAAVGRAYDLDDLDDEWKALLNEVDDRLYQGGRPAMDARERAVAIRSLLVSTARESPDVALHKALADIERFRRVAA